MLHRNVKYICIQVKKKKNSEISLKKVYTSKLSLKNVISNIYTARLYLKTNLLKDNSLMYIQ